MNEYEIKYLWNEIILSTRIMINKGMFNKGKYWIFGKNKGVSVSNFEEPKGRNKGIQYWISL